RGGRRQIVGDGLPDAAVRLRSARSVRQRSAVHQRLEAPLDQLRAGDQFVGLGEPVRLESQYARSLRRVLARGIAHARRSIGPLQRAQADWKYHGVRPLQYWGYRNPRVDVRRVQPGPEGDPPHGSPHDEVRVPLGTRDWLQVESAVEPVYLP